MLYADDAKELTETVLLQRFMQEHEELTTNIAQKIECAASEGKFEVTVLVPDTLVDLIMNWLGAFGYPSEIAKYANTTPGHTTIAIWWRD